MIGPESEYGRASERDSEGSGINYDAVYWSVHRSIYVRDTDGQSIVDTSFEVQASGEKRGGECGCVVGQWVKESKRLWHK